ncbi:hypothetical protein ACW5F0_14375 [Luteimonas sp. A534]
MTLPVEDILSALAAVLIAVVTVMSIRSGRVLWYPALIQIDRPAHRALFWTIIVLQIVAAAALAWLALS